MTLKEIRLLNNLTQLQVAKEINVDRSTYIKIERGEANLKADAIPKLCKLFNIDNNNKMLKVYLSSKRGELR